MTLIRRVDQEWLDTLNVERKKDQSGEIAYEVFEIVMDKLEKEWFNLVSQLRSNAPAVLLGSKVSPSSS